MVARLLVVPEPHGYRAGPWGRTQKFHKELRRSMESGDGDGFEALRRIRRFDAASGG